MLAFADPLSTSPLAPAADASDSTKRAPEGDFDQQLAAFAPGGAKEQSLRPPAPSAQSPEPAQLGERPPSS